MDAATSGASTIAAQHSAAEVNNSGRQVQQCSSATTRRCSAPRAWDEFAAKTIRIERILIAIALVASASASLQQSAGPYCMQGGRPQFISNWDSHRFQ
jgi:hypothetical protein